MSEILLSGLRAGTPIGFLGGLGAFRHACEMRSEIGKTGLSWTERGGEWFATLTLASNVDADRFLDLLVAKVCSLTSRPEFDWADQIKKNSAEQFRQHIQQNPMACDWFTAFGSEIALSKDGTLKSTAFDMTGGQQKLLHKLREASAALSAYPDAARTLLKEAIFGPWLYAPSTKGVDAENSHSIGLDPSTLLQGAFTSNEPASIKDKRGVRGAIWLAFESLPFFPCCVENGRLQTTAFFRDLAGGKWKSYFEWGVWIQPLSRETVETLLSQSREEWTRDRGIAERFRSERVNLNKDYYSLAVAELVTQ